MTTRPSNAWIRLAIALAGITCLLAALTLTQLSARTATAATGIPHSLLSHHHLVGRSTPSTIVKNGPAGARRPAVANYDDSYIRQAVVNAAKSYLGKPYYLQYGWTCSYSAMDCECLNRHAIWDGTYNATGTGLQLWYTLQGQINEGYQVTNPQPGDLVFWDTDPYDGNPYGGDEDHTGIYIGNGTVIDANAYYGYVKYDTTTLGGAYPYPIFIDVLSANGY